MQAEHSDRLYMDGNLQSNLDIAKKVIHKDWDFVFLIDGPEGSGKSVLAHQIAWYCDPTFSIENIAFTPEEFQEAIHKAKPFSSVVYDEAYTGLSSRGVMSDINKTLVAMLAEIRQKNLFVFIVMPTFFDLDRYVALWRSRALLHVYTDDDWERGYFAFFNSERKKQLYINGKKIYSYSKAITSANFTGRFTNTYVIDEQEYRKRKLAALNNYGKGKQDKAEIRLAYALKVLCNHMSLRQAEKELNDMGLDISHMTIQRMLQKCEENKL